LLKLIVLVNFICCGPCLKILLTRYQKEVRFSLPDPVSEVRASGTIPGLFAFGYPFLWTLLFSSSYQIHVFFQGPLSLFSVSNLSSRSVVASRGLVSKPVPNPLAVDEPRA